MMVRSIPKSSRSQLRALSFTNLVALGFSATSLVIMLDVYLGG